ncbi:hypothetical protein TRFO_25169 [Tritrichomonas foetus]|uniref:E3 ubiquitin-protein ligase n=1 Tax=Tritrichomonas foetus TaxID=1144522 RepID=A0A1J4KAJ2_9EUKA|nr:hypothetical protein TRFO_25169 [Tritrichomonas foetus]|eukprot:OHT06708.1 hypothetical protein TRFO_25169 [Tritrichomonas foetus]
MNTWSVNSIYKYLKKFWKVAICLEMTNNTDEKEEIEILSNKLYKLFETNTSTNIMRVFEDLLLEDSNLTFPEYIETLKKSQKKCMCQSSWSKETLTVHCADCEESRSSCICVPCFLAGDHKGHEVRLTHSISGTCDCGDPIHWKTCGFCSEHPGPEPHPEMTQLDSKTRIKLIAIAKTALKKLLFFASFDKNTFKNMIEWLQNIVSLGDASRRCVSIAFSETFEYIDLFYHSLNLDEANISKLLSFLGSLTNDAVFRYYFSFSVINSLPSFVYANCKIALSSHDPKKTPLSPANQLFNFTFHGFTARIVQDLITEKGLDWANIAIDTLKLCVDFTYSNVNKEFATNAKIFTAFRKVLGLLKSAIAINCDIEYFLDKFSEICVNHEFTYPIKRVFGVKADDPKKTQSVMFSLILNLFQFIHTITKNNIYSKIPLLRLKQFFESNTFQMIDQDHENENEIEDNESLYEHSVLSNNVQFSQTFQTHILAFCTLNLKENSLRDYINEVSDDPETFIKNWALLPLRWIAAADLFDYQFFVRNDSHSLTALNSFKFRTNIQLKFIPSFALIQSLLNSTNDIDSFYFLILHTYGFFDQGLTDDERLEDNQLRLQTFSTFFFIICLIFDTLCAQKDLFTMRRLSVISRLMMNNLSPEEIESVWFGKVMSDEKFVEDLPSFASRIKTSSGTKYRLVDDSDWHPVLPHLLTSTIISLIGNFVKKNPDSLIKFPNLPSGSGRLLFSPVLFSLMYHILSSYACNSSDELLQLVFNVLIVTSAHQNEENRNIDNTITDKSVIEANSFEELVEKLSHVSFLQFLQLKISYGINSTKETSIIDIIGTFRGLGRIVIDRLNIPGVNVDVQSEPVEKNRERAQKLKNRIMSEFHSQQSKFLSNQSVSDQNTMQNVECHICQLTDENDYLVYPALCFKNALPLFIKCKTHDRKLPKYPSLKSIRICLHPVHFSCLQKEKKEYYCPVDRCPRNCALPIFPDDYKVLKKLEIIDGIDKFFDTAYETQQLDEILTLYADEIEMVEYYHRCAPDCLDNQTTAVMLHTIFLCIWHKKRNDALVDDIETGTSPHLAKYIAYILQNNPSIINSVDELVFSMKEFLETNPIDLEPDEVLRFFRCAAIFDHFGLGKKLLNEDFIDWDYILSAEFLSKHYGIKLQETDLPMFSLIDLPKAYLDFIGPPYNFDFILANDKGLLTMCLLTGEIVEMPKHVSGSKGKYMQIADILKNTFDSAFSVFLVMNGNDATKVLICDMEFNVIIQADGVYVDTFGDVDYGMKRGKLLYLNEVKIEEVINKLLSGSWTNTLKWHNS